ncbi:MAG: hypothetical protein ACSW8D_16070, partial [Prevotella sp.]
KNVPLRHILLIILSEATNVYGRPEQLQDVRQAHPALRHRKYPTQNHVEPGAEPLVGVSLAIPIEINQ